MFICAIVALLSVLLTGCAVSRDPVPAPTAEQVRAAYGSAPCLSADLVARIQPLEGKAENVEVALRRRDDGRLRMDLARLDVVGVRLLAEADGSLTVTLPRENVVAQEAAHPFTPGLTPLTLARLLAQELVYGPLADGAIEATSDGLRQTDPATGLASVIRCDAATGRPVAKRLFAADGREALSIAYDAWRRFDTVERPARCAITVAGGPRIDLRVVRLRPVAAIAAGGLNLDIPTTARRVSLDQLGDLLAPSSAPGP